MWRICLNGITCAWTGSLWTICCGCLIMTLQWRWLKAKIFRYLCFSRVRLVAITYFLVTESSMLLFSVALYIIAYYGWIYYSACMLLGDHVFVFLGINKIHHHHHGHYPVAYTSKFVREIHSLLVMMDTNDLTDINEGILQWNLAWPRRVICKKERE